LRGPGETQLEVDRRDIGRRIAQLRGEIEKVRAHRSRYRARRKQTAIPTIAIVGYTNAGKSTLLNRLSESDVYVANELFATLDPTTRRVSLPDGQTVLMTDTVGFIQKLPTTLVAAFRATLEEISEADLLLHVVDSTHPNAHEQAEAVRETLQEINVRGLPMVTALNKIDRLPDRTLPLDYLDRYESAVPISARTGEGTEALLRVIEHELFESMVAVDLELPYEAGNFVNMLHEQGVVEHVDYKKEGIAIKGRIPKHLKYTIASFRVYNISGEGDKPETSAGDDAAA
jgi:GTP-binding protein HflX